ncbi:DUF4190 domain-containing protein [Frigoribacterium faeni]|uniref:Uncharacterized protein YacL n=2 Tax=Frigoribacterium faeni TaxID=145483 RepID=A0A7W3PJK2_9MICO|nr:DUF4190 domain-containing protein [Frigoribacterium faeni]MBA8814031.1 uncharacterized protein YacL [Frigoribacterium faeni]GEK82590.1 hypothetical protein FFA01_08990 [Frigoribacterium faeni]
MTDNDPARQGAQQPYGQQPSYQQNPYQGAYGQQNPKMNVLAIVSLVASILSSFFFSIVAVVTGHIALRQIKRTGEQGRVLAIIGLVLGYLGLAGAIVIGIFVIAAIAAGAFSYDYSTSP